MSEAFESHTGAQIDSDSAVSQALVAELGSDCVLLDTDVTARGAGIWRSDNIRAKVLVRPRTTAQVSLAMSICHRHNQSVIAHGGLTGLVESALTTESDVVISLERMNQIEAIHPLERTVIVQSGVVLQQLQEAVQEEGLMFSLRFRWQGFVYDWR